MKTRPHVPRTGRRKTISLKKRKRKTGAKNPLKMASAKAKRRRRK